MTLISLPGNNGTLNIISAKIHPTAHISTPVEYNGAPNNNSGALYHLNNSNI